MPDLGGAFDGDAGAVQGGEEQVGERDAMRVVAVEAEGLDAEVEESEGLGGDFVGLGEQGIGLGAGDEASVGGVSAVGEALGNELNVLILGLDGHGAVGEAEDWKVQGACGGDDSASDVGVALGLVVERSVGFQEGDCDVLSRGESREGSDLIDHEFGRVSSGDGSFEAAETGSVGEAGVGADDHSVLTGRSEGGANGVLITGMGAATDAGGADPGQELEIPGETFTQVGIEVERAGAGGMNVQP